MGEKKKISTAPEMNGLTKEMIFKKTPYIGTGLHIFDFDLKIFSKNNDFQYFHVGHLFMSSLWTHIAMCL